MIIGGISLFFLYLSSLSSLLGFSDVCSSIFLIVFSITFLKFISLKVGRINSVVFFFFFFYLIYGVTAPLSIMLGGGIPDIFSKPYPIDVFLFVYSLATTGVVFALITTKIDNLAIQSSLRISYLATKKDALINSAIFLCTLSAIFDFINNLRVGFEYLLLDKAEYQSQIQSLSFTVPTSKLYLVALTMFCLGVALHDRKVNKWKCLMFLIGLSPSIIIHLMTGQRGYLLTVVGVAFLSITYFKIIKLSALKFKYLFFSSILYISLVVLTVIRGVIGYSIEVGDYSLVQERLSNTELIVKRLNPAESEFGAPFGNFSEFIIKGGDSLQYGQTYLIAPVVLIPSFIYPGDKPTQAIYQFRDTFFQDEKYRGEIASTGFSSILEAFMNFGYLGVFFIFFLFAKLILLLEKSIWKSISLFTPLFAISLFNLSRSFHRSGFDTLIGEVFWACLLSVFAVFLVNLFKKYKI